jgi:hypothetical protein
LETIHFEKAIFSSALLIDDQTYFSRSQFNIACLTSERLEKSLANSSSSIHTLIKSLFHFFAFLAISLTKSCHTQIVE